MKEGYKLVVIVREDLTLSPGKLAVQVAHAAVSCALNARVKSPKWFKAWLAENQKKIVLRATLETIKVIEKKAHFQKLGAVLVRDAGLTEVAPGTETCLGLGPAPEQLIDRLTGSLPLL